MFTKALFKILICPYFLVGAYYKKWVEIFFDFLEGHKHNNKIQQMKLGLLNNPCKGKIYS